MPTELCARVSKQHAGHTWWCTHESLRMQNIDMLGVVNILTCIEPTLISKKNYTFSQLAIHSIVVFDYATHLHPPIELEDSSWRANTIHDMAVPLDVVINKQNSKKLLFVVLETNSVAKKGLQASKQHSDSLLAYKLKRRTRCERETLKKLGD